MNYINAINNFWSMNEVYSFSPTEIALYFYLLRVNNLCSWKQYFNHNNYKVMASINVKDLRTLSNARNKLKQAGLIDFRTRNGSAEANYSLFTSANYAEVEEKNSNYKSKTYAKNAEVSAQVSEQVYVEVSAEVFPSKDKLNKTKLNNVLLEKEPKEAGENSEDDFFEILAEGELVDSVKSQETSKRKKVAPKKEKVSRVFVPPSPQEVQSYCNERQNGINGDTFCDFYQSKDWMIGKNKMKDWKAAIRTWENDRKSKQQNQSQNGIQQRQNRNR